MKNGKLKSFLLGVKDAIPVISTIKENLESKHLPDNSINPETGKGKYDWVRLITSIAVAGLIAAFAFGKITLEDLKSILSFLN